MKRSEKERKKKKKEQRKLYWRWLKEKQNQQKLGFFARVSNYLRWRYKEYREDMHLYTFYYEKWLKKHGYNYGSFPFSVAKYIIFFGYVPLTISTLYLFYKTGLL